MTKKKAERALARKPSCEGVGLAVCNRLYRAAAFRFIREKKGVIVGLTGPTGAGKGYVSSYLKSVGCFVCDTDAAARELTAPGSPILPVLCESFGNDILNPDGTLNRKALAKKAFASKEQQQKLNGIMHPAILEKSFERCREALDSFAEAAVLDAPLLFESGADARCDVIISVVCPKERRLERILKRDGITKEEALERMSVQHDDEFYTRRSDYVIRSYAPYSVEDELRDFVEKYIR